VDKATRLKDNFSNGNADSTELEKARGIDIIETSTMNEQPNHESKAKDRHEARVEGKREYAVLQSFDTIEPESIEWLWPGHIAIGKESLFVGDPGTGKSQASLDVAARLSTGLPFPDGTKISEPADTVILTSEDDPSDTIRPRLDALEAEHSRVHYLKCKMVGEKSGYPSLVDLDVIQDAADQIRARGGRLRLLIVDPLEGYLDGADSYKNAEVRGVLAPLVDLASKERFAILGIQHLNKGTGAAAHRVAGSIAFTALARSVWLFARDPNDHDRRLFLCLKSNLSVDNVGLEYSIVAAENGASRISWGQQVKDDVRDILQNQPKAHTRIAQGQNHILELMRSSSPTPLKLDLIAEKLNRSKTSISNDLHKLRKQGLIKPGSSYGTWELSSQETTILKGESSESSENELHSLDSSVSSKYMVSESLENAESDWQELDGEL